MARTPTNRRSTMATPVNRVRSRTPANRGRPDLRGVLRTATGPFPKFNFRVFIDSDEVDVSLVSALHLPDGKNSDPEIRQTVTISRAIGQSRVLFDWNRACRAGRNDQRTVTIALLDAPDGNPVGIWLLRNARAVRWSGPDFGALDNGVATEELEIAYETIDWRSRA